MQRLLVGDDINEHPAKRFVREMSMMSEGDAYGESKAQEEPVSSEEESQLEELQSEEDEGAAISSTAFDDAKSATDSDEDSGQPSPPGADEDI